MVTILIGQNMFVLKLKYRGKTYNLQNLLSNSYPVLTLKIVKILLITYLGT